MIFTEMVGAASIIKILSTLLPNYRLTLSDLYRPISLTVELRGHHRVALRNMCHVLSWRKKKKKKEREKKRAVKINANHRWNKILNNLE